MKKYLIAIVVFAIFLQSCNSGANEPSSTTSGNSLPADSVKAIAKNAYVYGIALALIDITRNRLTNVEVPIPGLAAPINQFAMSDVFPNAKFRAVVRPNADTYYTSRCNGTVFAKHKWTLLFDAHVRCLFECFCFTR